MTVADYLRITDVKEVWFLTGVNKFDKFPKCVEKWGQGYFDARITKYLDKEITKVFVMSNGIMRIITNGDH